VAKLFSATRAKYFNKVLTYTLGYAILSVSKLRRQVMFEQFTLVDANTIYIIHISEGGAYYQTTISKSDSYPDIQTLKYRIRLSC